MHIKVRDVTGQKNDICWNCDFTEDSLFTVSFVKHSCSNVFLYIESVIYKYHINMIHWNLQPGKLYGECIPKNTKKCSWIFGGGGHFEAVTSFPRNRECLTLQNQDSSHATTATNYQYPLLTACLNTTYTQLQRQFLLPTGQKASSQNRPKQASTGLPLCTLFFCLQHKVRIKNVELMYIEIGRNVNIVKCCSLTSPDSEWGLTPNVISFGWKEALEITTHSCMKNHSTNDINWRFGAESVISGRTNMGHAYSPKRYFYGPEVCIQDAQIACRNLCYGH